MLAFVGIAIAVASVAKYKVTVKAEANIRPAGELRLVQAAAEGPVMRVWVKENQVVKKGDVIATIDDSRLQTKKSQLQSNIQQTQLQLVQIAQEELQKGFAELKSAQANLSVTKAVLGGS